MESPTSEDMPSSPDFGSESDSSLEPEKPKVTRKPVQPFRFLDLPAELRERILGFALKSDQVIDLGQNLVSQVKLLLVSKQFHHEAAAVFYGTNTFRILPTHSRACERRAKPVLRRLARRYRPLITSAELRFGPHWGRPPKCWAVDRALGLEQLTALRRLNVFVQADPSQDMYEGFRVSKDFYTTLAANLLRAVLERLPKVVEVHFDNYSGVSRDGPLITALVDDAKQKGKKITWGVWGTKGLETGAKDPSEDEWRFGKLRSKINILQTSGLFN